MQEDELLDAVQRRTGLDSRDEAYAITSATLGVLGQRITEGEARDIGSQLPQRIDDDIVSNTSAAEEFSAEEFVERVGDRIEARSEAEVASPEPYIQGVMTVLGDAVSGGELDDAREQLPAAFDTLFEPVDTSEQQV
jgi:uncharacterized protein (DUF2267 family)